MTELLGLLVLAVVVATDIWVYLDAKRCADDGSPVFLQLGAARIEQPRAWLVGCVLLWVVFFPIYLVSRRTPA